MADTDYVPGSIYPNLQEYFSTASRKDGTAFDLQDSDWMRYSFAPVYANGASGNVSATLALDEIDKKNRSFSTAMFKYVDCSVGGNLCINPPPGFTPYADVPEPGILPDAQEVTIDYQDGHPGMGPYYSEAIDDNNQIIHFQWGVPQFNSLTTFFNGFYNNSAAGLARTGRLDQSIFSKFFNFGLDIIRVAIIPLTILPIIFMMAGNAVRFFFNMPSSKFCYLKPTMPLYWSAVSSMVNQVGVSMGVINYFSKTYADKFLKSAVPSVNEQNSILGSIFPEYSESGVIDVYAIANKAKRLEMRFRSELVKRIASASDEQSYYEAIRGVVYGNTGLQLPGSLESSPYSLKKYWEKYISTPILSKNDGSLVERDMRRVKDVEGMDPVQADAVLRGEYQAQEQSTFEKIIEFALANAQDGSEYASFRVNYVKSASDSFSNQTAPNGLASQLNATSASIREKKMSFAGGKLVSLPPVVDDIVNFVGGMVSGALDMMYLGGLVQFGGNAFVDIPDNWASSQANVSRGSYTIDLVTPYGNPINQMLYIYFPLCMLLAGVLPLATGKQSYQNPFYCALYDRGRVISRFAMVKQMTIERGINNLSFNNNGQCMGIRVTLEVEDMSSIMTMPISQGAASMPLEGIFDGDNKFGDYLMTLGGNSLREVTDRFPLLMRQLSMKRADASSFFSASKLASWMTDGVTGAMMGALMAGTNKR